MHGMMKIFSNFKDFYNDINGATLTGAIDVIVVEQADGTYNCSPFHVRFGKLGVLRSREKVVDIKLNGSEEPLDIHMKLGESGEAFFVEELEDDDDDEIPEHLATSPIPVSELEKIFTSQVIVRRRSFDGSQDVPCLENQVNEYTKRRYTGDNESSRSRERDFLKRQIGLGNLDVGENSGEDMTLSMHSNKLSSEDLSKSIDISDTIFKMDSLEMDISKADSEKADDLKIEPVTTPVPKTEDLPSESKSSKKKRKRMRKKNAPRKSTSVNQLNSASPSTPSENAEKNNESITDRSSLDSNSSEPELKEIQKLEKEEVIVAVKTTDASNFKKIDADFHFFSDTELTANGTVDSRASSPIHIETVQSDSEFEVKVRKEETSEAAKSWEWGGFPNVSQTNSPTSENPSKEQQKSMLSGMFSFMKQKHGSHLDGGMYLSDISSGCINPEVAEIYFNKTKEKSAADADMDCESGNGPSLTQSPNSAEGCKSIDSDYDEHTKMVQSFSQDVALSLCGWDTEVTPQKFKDHVITFSDVCNNPILFENGNLVVQIRDKYYTWKVAAPIIASELIFGRPLLQSSVDQLCNIHMPPPANIPGKTIKQESRYSWWTWGRGKNSRETTPALESATDPQAAANTKDVPLHEIVEHEVLETKITITEDMPATTSGISNEDQETGLPKNSNSDKCRKTLRLTSKQIASLNLRDGMNEVEFSVTTAYQGTTRCQCHLYKWKWDDKIVISDIDGTITKSDVLGHILPIVGKDWAQTGVAQLFNKIKDNGYKLLYLSARAIGQARITRDYLKSIKQGDLSMPDGPILLNPTSLITAFHREVIEKKPEQFKISCMSDIKALFPTDSNPFYAGYGNRINLEMVGLLKVPNVNNEDVWAYRAVGIPIVRIFTINPKGELKHELTQTFQSSYSGQSMVVNDVFPPLLHKINHNSDSDDEIESSSESDHTEI